MKPLNPKQQQVFALIGNEWGRAPLGSSSATLLSLESRGLVECRMTPGLSAYYSIFSASYNSHGYEWRRKP